MRIFFFHIQFLKGMGCGSGREPLLGVHTAPHSLAQDKQFTHRLQERANLQSLCQSAHPPLKQAALDFVRGLMSPYLNGYVENFLLSRKKRKHFSSLIGLETRSCLTSSGDDACLTPRGEFYAVWIQNEKLWQLHSLKQDSVYGKCILMLILNSAAILLNCGREQGPPSGCTNATRSLLL